jgi:phospholipase/carboxylesterase
VSLPGCGPRTVSGADVVRRRMILLGAVAASATACIPSSSGGPPDLDAPPWSGTPARLSARPTDAGPTAAPPPPGRHVLDLGPGPKVLLHVPDGLGEGPPPRLVVTLHGAGGDAKGGLAPLLPLAEPHRLLLLAPSSQDRTWDVILGGWGPDVRRIDEALQAVCELHTVDPTRLAISGFSDGASYALSLGLANGDLFTHILAFSPGFVAPVRRVGTPRVFLSHGRADQVLPIDRTTRRIAAELRAAGVPVHVREFDGPHVVPPEIAEEAVRWFVA